MKLPKDYEAAKEKIELEFEQMIEKVLIMEHKILLLEEENDKRFKGE